MIYTSSTDPGSLGTPNEDWAVTLPGFMACLDGATVRTETGCLHGVPWFVSKLGAELVAGHFEETDLIRVLASAIARVRLEHKDTCDLGHAGTPSAAVGPVRMRGGNLEYLVLGDVTLVVETVDGVIVKTDPRVSETAPEARKAANAWPIGSDEKKRILDEQMKPAELAARNVEGGYWIAAAEPLAAMHSIVGKVPLDKVRRVVLMTDGAARVVDMFELVPWDELPEKAKSPDMLIRKVRKAEKADPDGVKHPRNKRHDDATIVTAEAKLTPPAGYPRMGDVFEVGRDPSALMGDGTIKNRNGWWLHMTPSWPDDLMVTR